MIIPTPQEDYHQHASLCADCLGVDTRAPFSRRCPDGKVLVKLAVRADIAEGRCMPSGQSFRHFDAQHKRST